MKETERPKIVPDEALLKLAEEFERVGNDHKPIPVPPAGVACKFDRDVVAALGAEGILRPEVDPAKAAIVVASRSAFLFVALSEKSAAVKELALLLARSLRREAALGPALSFAQEHISKSAGKWRAIREMFSLEDEETHPLMVPTAAPDHEAFSGAPVFLENSWWWTQPPNRAGLYVTRGWPSERKTSVRVRVDVSAEGTGFEVRAEPPFPDRPIRMTDVPLGITWRPV